jgi:hypothetical protein
MLLADAWVEGGFEPGGMKTINRSSSPRATRSSPSFLMAIKLAN